MTSIDLQLDGDECWPDLADLGAAGKLDEAALVGVALLPDAEAIDGLTGERKQVPVLTLRIALPHGRVGLALELIAELTAKGGPPT